MDIQFSTAVRSLFTALLPDHKTEVFNQNWYPVLLLNNLSQGMTTGNQTNDAIAKIALLESSRRFTFLYLFIHFIRFI